MKIRALGRVEYQTAWADMRAFTDARGKETEDELWIVEHPPVFTQGVAGKPEHLLFNPLDIPVVRTDRGGQITYHGPGQAMLYVLFDLKRAGFGVRELVIRIENAVIATLASYGVAAYGKRDAPGVYVNQPALGVKIRNGSSFHGVAFNVDMDLMPFSFINPCGYEGLRVTHLHELGLNVPLDAAGKALAAELERQLGATAK